MYKRQVPPTLADCELTFHAREPIDIGLAVAQHAAYGDLLRSFGLEVVEPVSYTHLTLPTSDLV